MNDFESAHLLQFLLLAPVLIAWIFFLLSQYNTLQTIRPENRLIPPGQVWLQLIPLVATVFQFIVISKLSNSIRAELNAPVDDSIFAEDPLPVGFRPTYNIGLTYAILFSCSMIPIPLALGIVGLAGFVTWIVYWVQLTNYKRKIKTRLLRAY